MNLRIKTFLNISNYNNIKIIYLPSFLSNYLLQSLIRLFYLPQVDLLYVFDDYPFLLHQKQILFLQQALLLTNHSKKLFSSLSFIFRLKQFLFSLLLLNSSIHIICQTRHMKNLLFKKYGRQSFILRHSPFY